MFTANKLNIKLKNIRNSRLNRKFPKDLTLLLFLTALASTIGIAVSLGYFQLIEPIAIALRENAVLIAAFAAIALYLYRIDVSDFRIEPDYGKINQKRSGEILEIKMYAYIENIGKRNGHLDDVKILKIESDEELESFDIEDFNFFIDRYDEDGYRVGATDRIRIKGKARYDTPNLGNNVYEEITESEDFRLYVMLLCSDSETSDLAKRYTKYSVFEIRE